VGTLRLARYTLCGVLLLLGALAARLAWAVHVGLTPPSWKWIPRVHFSGPWGVRLDFSQPTAPDAMPLLMMGIGSIVAVVIMIIVLTRFERREREAAIALKLSPPLPLKVEAIEPQRRLTLMQRLEKQGED